MQKCQSRENERPTSVQSVLSSPIHSLLHWPAAAVCSVTLSSAPFLVLVVDCCQRQCTGHSLPLSLCVYCQPSTAGLISDQANQIWSRNVHVCPLCPAFCVCVAPLVVQKVTTAGDDDGLVNCMHSQNIPQTIYTERERKTNTYCEKGGRRRGSIVRWTLTSMHTQRARNTTKSTIRSLHSPISPTIWKVNIN